jgi:hypothetical protein
MSLRAVNVGPGGGMKDEVGPILEGEPRDVELLARGPVSLGENLRERSTELPAGPRDQDAA